MKKYKIGIIGVYGRGIHACQAHRPEQGFEVVMGADPFDAHPRNYQIPGFKKFPERFPDATLVKDYRELVANKDIDIVFVMSPDYCHEEQAVAALEAGKAVYLEKPMAISIEGCDRILRTAYRTGSKLFIGHNMRYFPAVLKMKEIIDSGIIGDIQCGWCRHFVNYGGDAYFRDWHSEQKNTCGLLLQKGAHDIDVMHWLMGAYSKRVVGMGMLSVYNRCGRRPEGSEGSAAWNENQYPPLELDGFSPIIDVEDHNMIMMQLDNGAQATYMQCHYTPDAERNYTFIGTKGRVENIGDSGKCQVHVWTRRGSRQEPDIIYQLKPVEGSHGGADAPIIDNFLDFVANGAKTNANPVAARNSVAAGVLAHYSMRNGNIPQDIPQLEPELLEYFANNQQR
ncbi:MAG: Gfo/Idh/MocA family oxidoreductase [Lentisphaeria bacterium]|nr:Gfo/Idh/MocA family oxidoreductase [Lentisphaeria bacterium]